MARSRNIKPALFSNDELAENDPLGRILFMGLWTIADFKGDLIWREKRIKAQLLPYDNCDIKELAINLDKSGFIRFYSDQENIYLNVVNFTKHQNPHKNEKSAGSLIPSYSKSMRQAIDLKGLTINLDNNGINLDEYETNRADSLNLIPDSLLPIISKKEPVAKAPKFNFKSVLIGMGADEGILNDWMLVRKSKKAANTKTALNGFISQVDIAGISINEAIKVAAENSWSGFKASWYENTTQSNKSTDILKASSQSNWHEEDLGL